MKKIVFAGGLSLLTTILVAQTNYSGAYGYSFKPQGEPPKTESNRGPAGTLVLLKMDGNKYRFWLDVTMGWPTYHVGETDGTILFSNDTASFDNTFEDAEHLCILKFKIANSIININSLSTSFNCGFGNGVNADGDYTRLKNQPVLNNQWLKKEYPGLPGILINGNKAEIFQDENCLHPFVPKQYFIKGDALISISEIEKAVYTEHITASGKFVYGWLKKSDVKIVKTD